MTNNYHPQLGLDSQCFTYLIKTINEVKKPNDQLALQRIALLRLFIYTPGTLLITKTIQEEFLRIINQTDLEYHKSFSQTLFGVLQPQNPIAIDERTSCLESFHNGQNDCRIIAEAEDVGHKILLTYDSRLIRNLTPHTNIKLIRPNEYWDSLKIHKGALIHNNPLPENPLYQEAWWRW